LVCITINLYSFILYILNNFLKTNSEKKLLPRVLPTELIRRNLTVAFTDGYIRLVFQTLTDSFLDGLNPSAFDSSCHTYRRIYRRIYSVGMSYTHWQFYRWKVAFGKSRYHRRNENPSVYFKRETFFWRANSVCKTISKWFFFSDWYRDGMGNHRRKENRPM
jgi:hypothetical protein